MNREEKLPISSLSDRVRCVKRFRLLIEDGISPAKPILERPRDSKFVSLLSSWRNENESK